MKEVMIDVRERDEFDAEHVEGAINIPLSHFTQLAPGVLNHLKDRKIVIMCRSGRRAVMARDQIGALGFADLTSEVYEGGILKWKALGQSTIASRKGHLPIMRQVQLIAGFLVFVGSSLALILDHRFAFFSAAVGAGLVFAGITGICPMANVLAALPFNRTNPSNGKELCEVSPKNSSCCS